MRYSVGIPSDQNENRTEIVDNAIVVEQRIDGEWLAKGELRIALGHSFETRGPISTEFRSQSAVYEPYSGLRL